MPIDTLSEETIATMVAGSMFGVLIALGIVAVILFICAVYAYTSIAWNTIGKKLKYRKAWIAWVPIVRWVMILQLGGFKWGWIFLILVPVIGWIALAILLIISNWRVYEARRYPGWFSLGILIPQVGFVLYLIAIGFVAFADKTVRRVKSKVNRKTVRKKKKK